VAVVHLSEHVQKAIERERAIVAARLAALEDQSKRLHDLVGEIDADIAETGHLLKRMDEMLGIAPQLSLDTRGELRGQKLQEIAVELLRQKKGVGVEVHYREWFELLLEQGVRVAGKDPLGSFLTQVSRATSVESVRPRSGLYRLRLA
jgi:hypothetical protein